MIFTDILNIQKYAYIRFTTMNSIFYIVASDTIWFILGIMLSVLNYNVII